jgi:hypothetical protein
VVQIRRRAPAVRTIIPKLERRGRRRTIVLEVGAFITIAAEIAASSFTTVPEIVPELAPVLAQLPPARQRILPRQPREFT